MPLYRHVIWDWNGTLFDDAWLCRSVINGLLVKRGKPPLSEKRYLEVFDFPVKDYYRRAGFEFESEPFETLATEFMDEYERRRGECRLRSGAGEALQRCADSGLTQSILSVYPQGTLEQVVNSFGIRDFFTALHGLDNHYASGKVEIAKRMVREVGLERSHVVLIGDTTHDYEVAQAIGAGCILMPGGHHSRRRLEACGVPVVDSLDSVPSCLMLQH